MQMEYGHIPFFCDKRLFCVGLKLGLSAMREQNRIFEKKGLMFGLMKEEGKGAVKTA